MEQPPRQGTVRSKSRYCWGWETLFYIRGNFHVCYFNLSFIATIWGTHYCPLVQMRKLRLGAVEWCAQGQRPMPMNGAAAVWTSLLCLLNPPPSHTDSRRKKKDVKEVSSSLSVQNAVQRPLQTLGPGKSDPETKAWKGLLLGRHFPQQPVLKLDSSCILTFSCAALCE